MVIEAPRRVGDPSLLAARRFEPIAACRPRQRYTTLDWHHVHCPTGKRVPRVIAADGTRNWVYAPFSKSITPGVVDADSESL